MTVWSNGSTRFGTAFAINVIGVPPGEVLFLSAAHVLRPAWLRRADDRVQLTGLYLSLDDQHLTADHEDGWVIHPEFLPGRNINKDVELICVAASIPEDVVYEGRHLRLCQCMPHAGDVMEWVGFRGFMGPVGSTITLVAQ
jgi:hypothetical protein